MRGNEAVYDGGAAYINSAVMVGHRCTLERNMAVDEGGGANAQNGGNLTFAESDFLRNSAGGVEDTGAGLGSALMFGRSTVGTISSSRFFENTALVAGALYATEATVSVLDSDFIANRAKEGAARRQSARTPTWR